MNKSIQYEAETEELKRAIPFRCSLEDETNEGTSSLSKIQIGCSASLCLYLPASGLRSWRM